jgi:hypothetical protein
MRKIRAMAAAGALALVPVGVQTIAPAESSVKPAAAEAVNIYYFSQVRCVVGVYPVLSYLMWYKVRDYSYTEERAGWVDTTTYSHKDPPRYNIYYVGAYCDSRGFIRGY